jgi:NUMOD4 motif/HNH endonuclease
MVEWREVVGYEGLYQVSNDGQIRRHVDSGVRNYGTWPGRILKQRTDEKGYWYVCLPFHKLRWIHRIVAAAFIGPRPDGYQLNHKDGNKDNNHVTNLEYCTPMENISHAINSGLRDTNGEANGNGKLTTELVREIRSLQGTLSQRGIAKRYGITKTTVGAIHKRKIWRHVS